MKGWLASMLILMALALPAYAGNAPKSLFFTDAEVAAIENNDRPASAPVAETGIHLGAVFYYAPHQWRLWLQQKMWTPQTDEPHLHVIEVRPDAVRLSLTSGEAAAKEFTLRPYQTYRPATGDVVEGMH